MTNIALDPWQRLSGSVYLLHPLPTHSASCLTTSMASQPSLSDSSLIAPLQGHPPIPCEAPEWFLQTQTWPYHPLFSNSPAAPQSVSKEPQIFNLEWIWVLLKYYLPLHHPFPPIHTQPNPQWEWAAGKIRTIRTGRIGMLKDSTFHLNIKILKGWRDFKESFRVSYQS